MRKQIRNFFFILVLTPIGLTHAQQDVEEAIELELEALEPELADDLRKTRSSIVSQSELELTSDERAEAWGSLGMIYHAQYMLYSAQDAYLKALSFRDDFRWRHLLSVILIGEGKSSTAIAHLQQAVLTNPDYFPSWLRLGQLLLKNDELDEAQKAFEHANRIVPESGAALVGLADVAISNQDWSLAEKLLTQAWLKSPNTGQIAHKLVSVYRELDDNENLEIWSERASFGSQEPVSDDPLLIEVSNLSRNGRFFAQAGDWAADRGDRAGAIAAYANATRLSPENVSYGLKYTMMLYFSGQPGAAIEEAKRVIAIDINSAKSWYTLAWILRKSPHPEQYVQGGVAIRKAIELDDQDQYRILAGALAMGGSRFAEAQIDYFTLLERNPENAYFYYWFGMSRLAEGKCDGRDAIKRALSIRPTWGEAHVVMARSDAFCGELESAQERIQLLSETRDDSNVRLARSFIALYEEDVTLALQLAEEDLPNVDAQMIMNAVDESKPPSTIFPLESPWWLPPELD